MPAAVEELGEGDPVEVALTNARRKAARAVPKATLMITTFMVPATMLLLGAGMLLGSGTDFSSITGE